MHFFISDKRTIKTKSTALIAVSFTQAFKYVSYVSSKVKNTGPNIEFEVYETSQASKRHKKNIINQQIYLYLFLIQKILN